MAQRDQTCEDLAAETTLDSCNVMSEDGNKKKPEKDEKEKLPLVSNQDVKIN